MFRWLLDFGGGQIRDRGAHVMSIAQWIMNSDAVGPVTIDGRGEPPHDGMYDTADKMNVTYEFKNPDWTLIWAQPGEPSAELEARYGAVYWGDKGRLTVTLGDGAGTATERRLCSTRSRPAVSKSSAVLGTARTSRIASRAVKSPS